MDDPPTITLVGETAGGPPTFHAWTRDGEKINNDLQFTISISLKWDSPDRYTNSRYICTLTVIGWHPGIYDYRVSNSASQLLIFDRIIIGGQ